MTLKLFTVTKSVNTNDILVNVTFHNFITKLHIKKKILVLGVSTKERVKKKILTLGQNFFISLFTVIFRKVEKIPESRKKIYFFLFYSPTLNIMFH